MEAQRFPGDYDGIIAGAPANYWTHLLTQRSGTCKPTLRPASYIPAPSAGHRGGGAGAVRCDGRREGRRYRQSGALPLRPVELLCKDEDSDACLTAPQVAALKKIYAGP